MKEAKDTGNAFEANKKGEYKDPARLIRRGQKSEVTSRRHFTLYHASEGPKFQKPHYGLVLPMIQDWSLMTSGWTKVIH